MTTPHYENFPVASLLLPKRYREAVRTLYAFARSADDLADTPWASPPEKIQALEAYQRDLERIKWGRAPEYPLMRSLQSIIQIHHLPIEPCFDLLSAFLQDVHHLHFANETEREDYCRRSAHPVGRLLLALWEVPGTAPLLDASDAICGALQRINFLQDVAIDAALGRIYLPLSVLERHGVTPTSVLALCSKPPPAPTACLRALILEEAAACRALMHAGQPLLRTLQGRLKLELAFIMAGGLRILDKMEACQGDVVFHRPKLSPWDLPSLIIAVANLLYFSAGEGRS